MRNIDRSIALAALSLASVLAYLQFAEEPLKIPDVINVDHYRQTVERVDRVYSERIVDLPEDGKSWHTVFVHQDRNSAESRRLLAMFASTPRLQSLLAQTKTFSYDPSDRLYQARYSKYMSGEMPQFWLIRDDGKRCYKVSGANIPRDGEQMADEIAEMIEACCPRPRPQPTPQPAPAPNPPNSVPSIPDIRPADKSPAKEEKSGSLLIMAGAALAGGLLGAYNQVKGESSDG